MFRWRNCCGRLFDFDAESAEEQPKQSAVLQRGILYSALGSNVCDSTGAGRNRDDSAEGVQFAVHVANSSIVGQSVESSARDCFLSENDAQFWPFGSSLQHFDGQWSVAGHSDRDH
uniref:(northern house mosquito) hypothetical protein n=1 Tax=Culex pipiens TaxID=7175 RepID=A0A8D8GBJ2_CULPI